MKHSMQAIMPVSQIVSFSLAPAILASLGSAEAGLMSVVADKNDYIHVPIRALSAAPVQGGMFDFSHNGGMALQQSVNLFNNLTIFKDHSRSVDTWLGKTSAAYWDLATTSVPAGVNIMLDVDVKADPKAARGLATGVLDSGSVTVKFDYDQSHPEMDKDEFMWSIGDTVDGKVVCALVTGITHCMEYSVVWQGADKFAKVIGEDGQIRTPGRASNSLSLKPKQEKTMNLQQIALMLGLSLADNVTQEAFDAALKAHVLNQAAELTATKTRLTTAESSVAELTTSVTKLTTDLAAATVNTVSLTAKVSELTPLAETGTKYVIKTRSEALRLYNIVEGSKATPAMRALISSADLAVAESFQLSYADRADQLVPLKCGACGSTGVSRSAALHTTDLPEPSSITAKNSLESERMNSTLLNLHGK